jgi:hypothetical protein
MAGISRFGITDLQQNGPLLQVAIHPTQAIRDIFAKEGKTYQPATVAALIDTGASNSMIDRAIPKDLGINTVGQTTLDSATHKDVPSELFDLTFVIIAGFVKDVRCLEADFDGRPFRAIIGRDILASCLLVYTGWTNTYTLSQ